LMAYDYHKDAGSDEERWRLMHKLGLMYVNTGTRDKAVQLLSEVVTEEADLAVSPELATCATVYCRACMLQNIPVGPTMDKAINAAERYDLKPQLLDALITKASYADFEGRHTESMILLRGTVDMAKTLDLTAEAARGLNNLAFQSAALDEDETIRASDEALQIARKSGIKPLIHWHLTQQAFGAALRGQLDTMKQLNDDPMWAGAGDDVLSGRRFYESVAAYYVGDYARADELLHEAEDLTDPNDPQAAGWLKAGHILRSCFVGEPGDGFSAFDDLDGSDWWQALVQAWPLLLAVVLVGDPQQVTSMRQVFEPFLPRFHEELRLLSALESMAGRPEKALEGINECLDGSRRLDNRFTESVQLMAAARFLPDEHPAKSDFLDRARARYDEWGLGGFRDLLDRYVG
jgi:tetratricopeptide (TPR) repeat protein